MNTSNKVMQTESPKRNLMTSQGIIKKSWRKVKLTLLGVLMLSISLVSGCASNSTLPKPNSASVDSSLMVKPNYTERLVKLLSE